MDDQGEKAGFQAKEDHVDGHREEVRAIQGRGWIPRSTVNGERCARARGATCTQGIRGSNISALTASTL